MYEFEEVAIVTGAASEIGRASDQFYDWESAKAAVFDADERHGQETIRLIREANGESILIKADVANPVDCIALIRKTVARNHTITIANAYKSLILTQPIRVLDILSDRLIFRVPEQPFGFTLREKVHLYSDAFPGVITARLLELNIISGKFVLSDLTFSGQNWKERLCERIQPRESICVDMASKNTLTHAHLENLSVTGMRVIISRTKDKGVCTDCGASVRLAFQLSRDVNKMVIKVEIINSWQVRNLLIVGLRFFPSTSQEKQLNQYILARKAEILDELKSAFQKMHEPRQTQDLYF